MLPLWYGVLDPPTHCWVLRCLSHLHQQTLCGTIRLFGGAREDVADFFTGATRNPHIHPEKVEREINRGYKIYCQDTLLHKKTNPPNMKIPDFICWVYWTSRFGGGRCDRRQSLLWRLNLDKSQIKMNKMPTELQITRSPMSTTLLCPLSYSQISPKLPKHLLEFGCDAVSVVCVFLFLYLFIS